MQENIKNKNAVNTPSPQDTVQGDGDASYWNKWYIAVLLFLIVQIIIFYLITVEFKK